MAAAGAAAVMPSNALTVRFGLILRSNEYPVYIIGGGGEGQKGDFRFEISV